MMNLMQRDDFLENVVKKLISETLGYQQNNHKVNKESGSSTKLYLIMKYERGTAESMPYLGKLFGTRLVNTNTTYMEKKS